MQESSLNLARCETLRPEVPRPPNRNFLSDISGDASLRLITPAHRPAFPWERISNPAEEQERDFFGWGFINDTVADQEKKEEVTRGLTNAEPHGVIHLCGQ